MDTHQYNNTRRFLRHTLSPLLLILVCPPTAIIVWYTNVILGGSLLALWHLLLDNGLFSTLYKIWQPVFWGSKTAWSMILVFAISQLILMRVVPGKRYLGPVSPQGNQPVYKNNGFSCFIITLILFYLGAYQFNWFSATIIYDNFGPLLGALNIFSLVFCAFLYIKGRSKPSSSDHSHTGNLIFDYYWGTELYPHVFGWDIKMFTNCRFGMMSWPIILLSYAAKQGQLYGLSDSMIVAVLIQFAYLGKFFWWEPGYMRSIDIMHDRAGFYICWGCLVWVPSIYTASTLYLVNHPNHLGFALSLIILALGVTSVFINYFADAQRKKVREANGNYKVWGKDPVLIHTEYTTKQGERKKSILLASGWWGLARHFHYLPEILGALFWTLPALFGNILPYFYVVFLTILLVDRSVRDEHRCQEKYGHYWDEYCAKVPSRIIPGLRWPLSEYFKSDKAVDAQ